MAKHGKKYLEARAKIDPAINYAPDEAVRLVRETASTKFDSTVEVHLRMGVDPRHADQQIRGVVLMPSGTGKEVRILVFAEGDAARAAEEAGADFVGSDELVNKIQAGWTDFDMAIATPSMMKKVGRLGRVLGPRGLMPSPKAGTIVEEDDLGRVISEARQGRVEFKIDKTANLHMPIGKASFTQEQLLANMIAAMDAVVRAKPTGAKGIYIKRVTMTSTMGPGIRVDANQAAALKVA
ncbi:MAG: 50S ribosomal protein L1 [Anaerolineae bacterium]|nr:50S ribosomal protein L1 [Anaerolineae bacterium]MCB9131235.1 50S ribosomal protein L1 [Anaerolineales bacterium]MCB0227679.1 50S ribosomal protein L1 [Anaerolineae bacterium]MCB0238539.1 50S ribosomal protein L1 [Anaerolineae bacterium]MCB0241943.1 50S ribosomal protein L1 [Anaerolineae bacterium]